MKLMLLAVCSAAFQPPKKQKNIHVASTLFYPRHEYADVVLCAHSLLSKYKIIVSAMARVR